MKKLSPEAIALLIVLIIAVVCVAVSAFIFEWIANSDLPTWLKYLLLK